MKGNITISKHHLCGANVKGPREYICIRVEDGRSSINFLTVNMSLVDFAKAITGASFMPMEFELGPVANVGKQLETKTEKVEIRHKTWQATKEETRSAIAKYEKDGWMGRDSDAENYHHHISGSGDKSIWSVSFHRFVPVEEASDA